MVGFEGLWVLGLLRLGLRKGMAMGSDASLVRERGKGSMLG